MQKSEKKSGEKQIESAYTIRWHKSEGGDITHESINNVHSTQNPTEEYF
jgi:hypothetical protein